MQLHVHRNPHHCRRNDSHDGGHPRQRSGRHGGEERRGRPRRERNTDDVALVRLPARAFRLAFHNMGVVTPESEFRCMPASFVRRKRSRIVTHRTWMRWWD